MRLFQVDLETIYCFDIDYFIKSAKGLVKRAEVLESLGLMTTEMRPIKVNDPEELANEWRTVGSVSNLLVNDRQYFELCVQGQKPEIKKEIPVPDDGETVDGAMRKFNRLAQKLISLPGLNKNDNHHDAFNARCNVHMPGQAMSTYNEVLLLENACSDELQRSLDSGWRIISACPQPDARRPDYILGRFDPNREVRGEYAKRSPE